MVPFRYPVHPVKLIMPCGTRLRITQMCHQLCDDSRYKPYLRRVFETVGNNCPNIERIITSSKPMKKEWNVTLRNSTTDVYATQIYESTGKPCKLRSITFYDPSEEHRFKRILNLYPNLEELDYKCNIHEKLRKCSSLLHQFIENGLKDLKIFSYKVAWCGFGTLWKWKESWLLIICRVQVGNNNHIAVINKTQGSKNLRLDLLIYSEAVSLFNDVCKFIVELYFVDNNEND